MVAESVTLHDRQQEIIKILRRDSSAKVSDLSKSLGVSQVTIRSDLDGLEEEGYIERVRGGAVLKDGYQILSPTLAERAKVNEPAKYRIARRAAEMVQDGDLILLDDSTTALYMVPHLKKRKSLTIVTNGVETALALGQENSGEKPPTAILLGGVLHNSGASVVGSIGEANLRNLRIKKAFLSCTGFSLELGMTHHDLQEAHIKRQMVASTEQVIALVDASKFGKTDLTPFAFLENITHLVTDEDLEPSFLEALHHVGATVTVCGETTVSTLAPKRNQDAQYRIGFANLGEDRSEFAVAVRRGLERAAQEAGNIDLTMADNQLDAEVALGVADHLVASGVDLAIEYQIDEQVGSTVSSKFNDARIPVIAVDIPMVGATYFGVDNYRSGYMAGTALGEWTKRTWGGGLEHLLILQFERAAPLLAARIRGQIEGLEAVVGTLPAHVKSAINGGTTANTFEEAVYERLVKISDAERVAILSFNDNATMGAVKAARNLGRRENLVIVGQGADRQVRAEIRNDASPVMGATAFWPERYGDKLIELATAILHGEPAPPAVYIEHVFLGATNINQFYPEDEANS